MFLRKGLKNYKAPIEVLVIGDELEALKRISYDIEQIIKDSEGTMDVDNPMSVVKTDLKVDINKDKASIYGLSLAEMDQTIRAGLNGLTIDRVKMDKDDDEYPLVMRIGYDGQPTIDDFDKIYFDSAAGHQIPLRHVARLKFEA